jgi:hypothetical protein
MTPVQRITLTCRQTGEQASRLLGWLEDDQAYALQRRGLRDEIDGAFSRLAEIRHAVDLPPSLGVIGGSGAGKTKLIAALASLPHQSLVAEFSGGQIDLNVMDAVLPPAGHQGIGVVLRFSATEGPVAPKGLPVRLGLLSQTDLVRIITRGYHTHFPASRQSPPSAARLIDAFGQAERALIAQSVVGLSARDINDLRNHLHGFYPESTTLRALSAGRYWDQLSELAAHLPDLERRRLLALLWNEEPGLTHLFGQLCNGLERLGHAHEIFAPIEALATKERGTGWVVPHPRSIVAAATMQSLGHGSDEKLRVAGHYGQIVELERAVIAGLAAELPMRLASPQLAALKPAQILEFPSPPTLVDFDPGSIDGEENDPTTSGSMQGRAALFAHVKASFLLERACQRHELTSLLVCVDPMTTNDEDVSPAVAEWIETTQGSEPHQRERLRTGLFVVGTKLDQLFSGGVESGGPAKEVFSGASLRDAAQRWGDRLGAKLTNEVGANQEWPQEWTPGRAFHNVYLVQQPVGATGEQDSRATSTGVAVSQRAPRSMSHVHEPETASVLTAPRLARFVSNPNATWSGVTAAVDGGIGHLLSKLVLSVQPSAKHRQLNTHLVDLRRRLRSRLLRLHLSNDPAQIAEWRRQLAIVGQGRLQRVAQADRMHILHVGLGVTEHELNMLYSIPSDSSDYAGFGVGACRADAVYCEKLGNATVEYWLQSMRQVARSSRFCRSVGVSQPMLHHIIDEISMGAMRLGLAARLNETFYRAAQAPTEKPLTVEFFAVAAARLIGGYVERLALPEDSRTVGSVSSIGYERGQGRLASELVSDVAPDMLHQNAGRKPGQVVSGTARAWSAEANLHDAQQPDGWAEAFGALAEANIVAAAHLTGGAARDRDLGELLAGFLASPLEVDP